MHLEDSGLIFDVTRQPPARRAASFVGLCPLASGTVLCSFQVGPRKHAIGSTLAVCRSDDGGRTWRELPAEFQTTLAPEEGDRSDLPRSGPADASHKSDLSPSSCRERLVPGSLAAGEIVEVGPDRLLLLATWFDRTEPDRPLFDPETEGILHSRQFAAESRDGGLSWSAWREVPTPGLAGCSLTGPVLRWPDGTIGLAFESYKEFDDPRPARHAAWLMVSTDGGATFGPPLLVAQHPEHAVYYWDQRLAAGPRVGELVAMFWTHDLAERRDLTVHLRRTTVDDLRAPAAQPAATSIRGQIAAPLAMDDGRLLAFVVDRAGPSTMKLWLSADGGRTWPPHDALVVYAHDERAMLSQGQAEIDFKQYWDDMVRWSFGHPAIRRLDEDRVLLAWYAGPPDRMSVHWARVRV